MAIQSRSSLATIARSGARSAPDTALAFADPRAPPDAKSEFKGTRSLDRRATVAAQVAAETTA